MLLRQGNKIPAEEKEGNLAGILYPLNRADEGARDVSQSATIWVSPVKSAR